MNEVDMIVIKMTSNYGSGDRKTNPWIFRERKWELEFAQIALKCL